MVVPLASPGRIIIVLFWTKYAFRRQIKSGILSLIIRRGQAKAIIALSLFLLASKKKVLCRFRRIVNFWLPLVLRAQPPYAMEGVLELTCTTLT